MPGGALPNRTDAVTDGEASTTHAREVAAATVEALARALELHDYRRGRFGETAAHTARVTRLSMLPRGPVRPGADARPPARLRLSPARHRHDRDLQRDADEAGALTPAEIDEIREHPWLGERIVAPVPLLGGLTRQVIACHHERWNGSGYPRGLRGIEIPVAARIFAVVDAFDSITNEQPYRDALPIEAARDEIHSKAGLDFDPDVVEAFLALELPVPHTEP